MSSLRTDYFANKIIERVKLGPYGANRQGTEDQPRSEQDSPTSYGPIFDAGNRQEGRSTRESRLLREIVSSSQGKPRLAYFILDFLTV